MLVPSFFFVEAAIEKRPPLSPMARRAGWIGCNILLSAIAPEGKIRLIANGIPIQPGVVRQRFNQVRPLGKRKGTLRGWTLNVLRFVHQLGKSTFSLDELYAMESELALLYPANRNIRAKIRQQLQILRDIGLVSFLGKGVYSVES